MKCVNMNESKTHSERKMCNNVRAKPISNADDAKKAIEFLRIANKTKIEMKMQKN